jgi:arylsulfatase A
VESIGEGLSQGIEAGSRLKMTLVIDRAIRTAGVFALLLSVVTVNASDPPNVILMMADDLGYNDLSCYGSERIRTPQLDKMAREGVRLTSFYAGSTVCTPSRMALLTGAYPVRLGWPGGVVGYKIDWKHGLAAGALTIAEIFKDSGYTTGMCGKWHLGDGDGMRPMEQGFDSAYYIKSSNNQTKKLWRGEELVADPFDNRRLSELFAGEAIKFIQANRAEPFFLYLPFTAPHFPAQAHPDWKGNSSNEAYGDVVEELDHRVGEILNSLESQELDRKTIVVFLSDNGPEPGQKKWASAKPYRGLKWSSLEGGTRVPCIVRWPGVIPANRRSDELTAAIDLLPTLAHACGIDLDSISNASPKIDGVNVWNTLIGKESASHARTNLLYWNGWAIPQAIRLGKWKLYFDEVEGVPGSEAGPALFDLATDLSEETNLGTERPGMVAEMIALAQRKLEDIEANALPLGGASPPNQSPNAPRWLK